MTRECRQKTPRLYGRPVYLPHTRFCHLGEKKILFRPSDKIMRHAGIGFWLARQKHVGYVPRFRAII